jgi:ABC-type thiamine transport system substrate-binding protein
MIKQEKQPHVYKTHSLMPINKDCLPANFSKDAQKYPFQTISKSKNNLTSTKF